MKAIILKIIGTVAVTALVIPASTQAYSTTGQLVKRINDDHALFIVAYDFGFLNRATYLPIVASRGTTTAAHDVEFTIQEKSGSVINEGTVTALVLSNATIKDGRYYLAAGEAAEFALVGIMRLDNSVKKNPALAINDIPLIIVKDGKSASMQFPPGTFANYKTKHLR